MPKRSRDNATFTKKKKFKSTNKPSLAKLINAQIQKGKEKKYRDHRVTSSAVSWSGTITHISLTSQGVADVGERIGDEIQLTSIKGMVKFVGADAHNFVRFVIFQFFGDPFAAVPTVSELFQNSDVGTVNAPIAPFAKDFVGKDKKLRILHDSGPFMVMGSTDSSLNAAVREFQVNRSTIDKFGSSKLTYAGSGTTPKTGAIYIATISDSAVTAHPDCAYVIRLRYTDA